MTPLFFSTGRSPKPRQCAAAARLAPQGIEGSLGVLFAPLRGAVEVPQHLY
jgi:hypothetical protein